jgi:hypothetical protein
MSPELAQVLSTVTAEAAVIPQDIEIYELDTDYVDTAMLALATVCAPPLAV